MDNIETDFTSVIPQTKEPTTPEEAVEYIEMTRSEIQYIGRAWREALPNDQSETSLIIKGFTPIPLSNGLEENILMNIKDFNLYADRKDISISEKAYEQLGKIFYCPVSPQRVYRDLRNAWSEIIDLTLRFSLEEYYPLIDKIGKWGNRGTVFSLKSIFLDLARNPEFKHGYDPEKYYEYVDMYFDKVKIQKKKEEGVFEYIERVKDLENVLYFGKDIKEKELRRVNLLGELPILKFNENEREKARKSVVNIIQEDHLENRKLEIIDLVLNNGLFEYYKQIPELYDFTFMSKILRESSLNKKGEIDVLKYKEKKEIYWQNFLFPLIAGYIVNDDLESIDSLDISLANFNLSIIPVNRIGVLIDLVEVYRFSSKEEQDIIKQQLKNKLKHYFYK
jgi:hypothetical protein